MTSSDLHRCGALGVGFAVAARSGAAADETVAAQGVLGVVPDHRGFQLLVNGVLTGQRLVVYSPHAIVGGATPQLLGDWHMAYAPFEDLLFGFSLVLQTLSWWIWWGRRSSR